MKVDATLEMPGWVPTGALHYLAHTERGQPIRVLARAAGCHASTVLRQIRRVETRRDDPLVDAALRKLGQGHHISQPGISPVNIKERSPMASTPNDAMPDKITFERESMRVLRRLCETGAVLAIAAEMDNAVVVRDTVAGGSARTAVVSSTIAQAMALKDWIVAINAGRIIQYRITASGRAALTEMLEKSEEAKTSATGFSEAQTPFAGASDDADYDHEMNDPEAAPSRRARYNLAESPLAALARRRDKQGKPFLREELVHAGERLREDFELAQMGAQVTQNWDRFLTAGASGGVVAGRHNDAPSDARARVAGALADLGPGLSDVVLRCCCYLEGLETTEKRLGWSARSGKVVLRIALMRLKRHYDETIGPGGAMIG